jgi:arylsulfatase A-like enzyme
MTTTAIFNTFNLLVHSLSIMHILDRFYILLFLLVSLIDFSCEQKKESQKPNVLFILADDLGYHDLSVMGSQFYETPNIDRIANEGMIFTQGYAACQVCSPSRASIMTGKFPARHGITDWIGSESGEDWRKQGRHNQLLPAGYVHQLPAEYTTLPEAMKKVGYKTYFAGKWHLGKEGSFPEDHGFDINVGGYESGGPKGGYFDPYDNPKLPNRKPGENLSMRLAGETVDFLNENNPNETGQPVFAFLSFYAVHGPIQTTQEKWRKYRDKAEQLGIAESGYEMGYFLPIRQVQDNPIYAGLVEAMDDAVGLLLTELDRLGLDENTIIIFTSDNGGVAAGDAFATSNKPLRGGKGYQYEGGIREPYFIKVPSLTKAGQRSNVPVIGTDFYPTILELIGAKQLPDEHTDGQSLVPLMKGETIAERPLIWHYPHYGNQGGRPSSIIREGQWKLIHYYEDSTQVLYNLDNDLKEVNDLAFQYPDRVIAMSKKLFSFLKETGARFPEKDPEYAPEKEQEYLTRVLQKKLPKLEQERLLFLDTAYNPRNNWWGSQPE